MIKGRVVFVSRFEGHIFVGPASEVKQRREIRTRKEEKVQVQGLL